MNLVLFGPPGSGKGTQAARLKERFALEHVSTGDLLRAAVVEGTGLGRKVQDILASGELVSDDVVLELIREAVAKTEANPSLRGWMLDGFPRTMGQAQALGGLLREQGGRIDAVVVLEVDRKAVIERLSARRTCVECRAVYNLTGNPPRQEGKCDRCGGNVIQRSDDEPATISNRLDVYEAQTRPILEYYESDRVPIHRVDGGRRVDEVTSAIEDALR